MAVAGVGFLSQTVAQVRKYIAQPEYSTQFTDAEILAVIRDCWQDVVAEIFRASEWQSKARVNISVVALQEFYALPPIARFLLFEKINAETLRPDWELVPNHALHPFGPGFSVEGPVLRLEPVWQQGETLRVTYIPTFDAEVVEFTQSSATASTTTAPTSPTAGTLDTRPHAYVGYTLRSLNLNPAQLRLITGFVPDTRIFTASPAFDSIPGAGTQWEVIPLAAIRFRKMIAFKTARIVTSAVGDLQRSRVVHSEYQDSLRSIRLDDSQKNGRSGRTFQRAVRGQRPRRYMRW